ncbi:Organic hydroperoxide resistance transcriptional regulator [Streptomyces sp. MBT84]|jgi:DNA-binding MarR family transcriptional regulator|uniref:MarR family winged helix-turn-helix transcriptional regulator n=1 Tax=unclassified Streptomyces TaxID=2593676 RepID=UPI000740F578|nr:MULTISPECIES: MarR family transcriptional regulator [unclassified Streptomyces]KUJ42985.1 MarR family transcriptional regulator [Streptomyces sp. NRRL F-5122]MBW8703039.1 Organic hydroperoxide resistance transcriptional regulator [Streptomyces sp. MBT84]MDX3265462.1 MarR family transcriptional regulator [Streptomyces sp. MI02-2A]REE61126.1 DNA-binding MarR family transcriptional regulator [Streptomyces sp. 3212.3]
MTTTPTPGAEASAGEEFLRLDRQICFSLHAASRAFNSVYRIVLKDLGLTYPQYLVMLVLWEHGELPVKSLGEHLRLDSGTLSPLLKRLEAAGLVRRERSREDERSVHVRPTEEGTALKQRALLVPIRIAAATGFELEEVMDLHARLDRLTHALDETALQEARGCVEPADQGSSRRT